jgi:hypothetical protein
MILDLCFSVRRGKLRRRRRRSHFDGVIQQPSVNDTTEQLAPEAPVKEVGNVLPRLLNFVARVLPEEHIPFSKMDLANGY